MKGCAYLEVDRSLSIIIIIIRILCVADFHSWRVRGWGRVKLCVSRCLAIDEFEAALHRGHTNAPHHTRSALAFRIPRRLRRAK